MSTAGNPTLEPVALAVAPNGGRRGKSDHPALPITPAELARMAQPAGPAPIGPGLNDRQAPTPRPATYINASDIKIAYPKLYLAEEADVDQYLTELRKTLMAAIQQGKKVIV